MPSCCFLAGCGSAGAQETRGRLEEVKGRCLLKFVDLTNGSQVQDAAGAQEGSHTRSVWTFDLHNFELNLR